ncbi:hypothetical protein DERA104750_14980 [Deinococcus radiodurans]
MRPEEALSVGNRLAPVKDADLNPGAALCRHDLDALTGGAVLEGVFNQVEQHLQQFVGVGAHEVVLPEGEFDLPGRHLRREQPLGAGKGLGQRQRAGAGRPEPHREVLDQPRQPLGFLQALAHEVLGEVLGHVVFQRLQHAAQGRHRRAEFVREHRRRLAQFGLPAAVLGHVFHDQGGALPRAGAGAAQGAASHLQFEFTAALQQGFKGVAPHDFEHRAPGGALLRHPPQPHRRRVDALDQPALGEQHRLGERVHPAVLTWGRQLRRAFGQLGTRQPSGSHFGASARAASAFQARMR